MDNEEKEGEEGECLSTTPVAVCDSEVSVVAEKEDQEAVKGQELSKDHETPSKDHHLISSPSSATAAVLGGLKSLGWFSWTSQESQQDSAAGTPTSTSGGYHFRIIFVWHCIFITLFL